MRALVLGLVGVVIAAGAAEAKVCRLDGLKLAATARDADASKDLVGASFDVVRQSSHFKTGPDPVKGGTTTRGTITIEITGPKGTFVVDQDYEPTSMPWVSAGSRLAADDGAKVKWGVRDRRTEARVFESDGAFDIYSGPLSGLSLEPQNCVQPRSAGKLRNQSQ